MSVSRFVFVYAPLLVAVPPFVAAAVDVFRSLFCVWLRLCVCMADCLDPGGGHIFDAAELGHEGGGGQPVLHADGNKAVPREPVRLA